jgi:hypothetical protein
MREKYYWLAENKRLKTQAQANTACFSPYGEREIAERVTSAWPRALLWLSGSLLYLCCSTWCHMQHQRLSDPPAFSSHLSLLLIRDNSFIPLFACVYWLLGRSEPASVSKRNKYDRAFLLVHTSRLASNAYGTYTDSRSFLTFLAESNHAWLGKCRPLAIPSSFYPRGMPVC